MVMEFALGSQSQPEALWGSDRGYANFGEEPFYEVG
jgi:hypothetical protein